MEWKSHSLTDEVLAVVRHKGTEPPFMGEYNDFGEVGTYLCRLCGLALFRSMTQFHSSCGWPSFDEAIAQAVETKIDADGHRVEMMCVRCKAHLGHVFSGEGFTVKNTRYCVNSLSLDFVTDLNVKDTEEAIFAAGCFWGVEHLFRKKIGVLKAEVGYSGGQLAYPCYDAVCQGGTGHYEVTRVVYDPVIISYEAVAKYFFEIHDPTQTDGQGRDRASYYQSAAFYYDDAQKQILFNLIMQLKSDGLNVVTKLLPVSCFWKAEEYHQHYYHKRGRESGCHRYKKRFE